MPGRDDEISVLSGGIALLEQYQKAHSLSLLVTMTSTGGLLYLSVMSMLSTFWLWTLMLIIVAGFAEMVVAIRIGFDLALLRQLAGFEAGIKPGLKAIDHALTRLHLLPHEKTGRDLDSRLQGCIHLFKIQVRLCGLQYMVVLIAIIVKYLLD